MDGVLGMQLPLNDAARGGGSACQVKTVLTPGLLIAAPLHFDEADVWQLTSIMPEMLNIVSVIQEHVGAQLLDSRGLLLELS